MNHDKVLELCRQLIALNDDPHPGLVSWNMLCANAAEELRQELNKGETERTCDGSCEPMCAWCNRQADIAAEERARA